MIVYTIEIYDATEYNNCLIEIQVCDNIKEAEKYIEKEIKKYKSYQDIYTRIELTEWYGIENYNIIWIKTGKEIIEELKNNFIKERKKH